MNDLMIGRVFVRHGSYHYDLGRDENGTRRSKKLSRIVDGEPALYKALAELNADPKATTISDMLTVYLTEGMVEMGLSPRTQHDYCSYAHTLRAWCGDLTPDQLTTSHVAQYLRQRRKAGGRVVANKEIACLSSAYQYGLELGMCEKNPCRGVRRNKTTPRKRYVRDEEFDAILQAVPDYVADFMMGIYLMGLRPGEVMALQRSSIKTACIKMEESKTGKVREIMWSDELRHVVVRAMSRFPGSKYVFTNSRGEKWTKDALATHMSNAREKVGGASFTFHDLRAKAESDHAVGLGLMQLYKRRHVTTPVR